MNYYVRFESLQEWLVRNPAVAPFWGMPNRIMKTAVLSNEVFDQLASGITHPNPRVRFETAHLADHLDDERSFPVLLALCHDPMPKVRAEALHGLACERCNSCPLPVDGLNLLIDAALHDESDKVRHKMVDTFPFHSPDPRIEQALSHIAAHDCNPDLRTKAEQALQRLRMEIK
ncbi:MAG: HEAT repeat domain-containing protein [Anaerolineales bacterium]|nr:HEAT repeat domain-containing protein [Anaerolineales bacterium]